MGDRSKKAIFLDRDGTINLDRMYLFRREDFIYFPGAIEGLAALQKAGFLLIIITNQSGIARGYYTEQDYLTLDAWMREDLAKKGVKITKSYYCPHLPDAVVRVYAQDCNCRKPKTGLFWKAARDLNVDMDRSFAIGDRERDLTICKESGVKGILLSNAKDAPKGVELCRTWEDALRIILKGDYRDIPRCAPMINEA